MRVTEREATVLPPAALALARCGNLDPAEFSAPTLTAKRVCLTCPVEALCRAHGLHPLVQGVGTSWPGDPPLPGVKRCPHCQSDLPLDAFYREPNRPDGLSGWCRACKNSDAMCRHRLRTARGAA